MHAYLASEADKLERMLFIHDNGFSLKDIPAEKRPDYLKDVDPDLLIFGLEQYQDDLIERKKNLRERPPAAGIYTGVIVGVSDHSLRLQPMNRPAIDFDVQFERYQIRKISVKF
jgi:hypothetical protein